MATDDYKLAAWWFDGSRQDAEVSYLSICCFAGDLKARPVLSMSFLFSRQTEPFCELDVADESHNAVTDGTVRFKHTSGSFCRTTKLKTKLARVDNQGER